MKTISYELLTEILNEIYFTDDSGFDVVSIKDLWEYIEERNV